MSIASRNVSEERPSSGNGICRLLIAEDNLGDFVLLTRTLAKMNVHCTIVRAQDGQEALEYLEKCGEPPLTECPTHFILDLKMPILGGFEVLEWVRANNSYKDLHVIVLSSSAIESDMLKAEKLGVDAYLVKPAGLDELAELVRKILAIWNLPHQSQVN